MKKIFLRISVFVICVLIFGGGWLSYRYIKNFYYLKKHETPEEYKNYYIINHKQYTKDSLYLSVIIKEMRDHNAFEYNPVYYNVNSKVVIDTIIYNKSFNKLAIWGICISIDNDFTKSQYYSGGGYLAFRDSVSKKLRVSLYFGPDIGRKTYLELKDYLKKNFFIDQFTWQTPKDKKTKYNWNDIRMWSGAEWDNVLGENSFSLIDGKLIKYSPQDSILYQR